MSGALGRVIVRDQIGLSGEMDVAGTYILAEGVIPIVPNDGRLRTVFTGYYMASEAMIKRAYTVNGGTIEQSDAVTELRLGLNWSQPLSGSATFTGRLEAVRRFEPMGTDSSGEVIGLSEITVPGIAYHQHWLQARMGIDLYLSGSLISVALDAATVGEAPAGSLTVVWCRPF